MTGQQTRKQARTRTSGAGAVEPSPGSTSRHLAQLLAVGLGAVVACQLALAAGAPFGSAAYGGGDPGRLSSELRITSMLAAGFWLLACLTALARGGVATSPITYALSRRAIWGLTVLLAAGAVMNAASSSPWGRFGMAPFIVTMTAICPGGSRDPATRQSGKATRDDCGRAERDAGRCGLRPVRDRRPARRKRAPPCCGSNQDWVATGRRGPLTVRYAPGLRRSFRGPSTTRRQMRSLTHAALRRVSRPARALSSGRTSWM